LVVRPFVVCIYSTWQRPFLDACLLENEKQSTQPQVAKIVYRERQEPPVFDYTGY